MANIIEEYLVKLGFSTDVAGYDKFQKSLNDASSVVTNNTSGMIRKVAEFETAAIAGFAAVGAAVIHMADKAAMADQSYRLFALHMYTTQKVARQLQIGMDALGASLEDISYDPELARRFRELVQLQNQIRLPKDFEGNMEKVRDLRQSFVNLYEFIDKYLLPMITNSLVRIFGKDMDQMLAKVKEWTNYLIEHMPEIADFFADTLTPILRTAEELFSALWEAAKEFMQLFTQVVGLLTGDEDLKKATTDWRDFGKAVQEVAIFIGGTATDIIKIVSNVMKLVQALILIDQWTRPDITSEQRDKIADDFWAKIGSMKEITPEAAPPSAPSGMPKPAPAPIKGQLTADQIKSLMMPGESINDPKVIRRMIDLQAQQLGVDPQIAEAVALHESHFQQFTKSGAINLGPAVKGQEGRATGVFQLIPKTAQGLGVNPEDTAQNIFGGVKLLADLMAEQRKKGGTVRDALAHYEGRGGPESYQQVDKIVHESGINIDTININVPSGDPEQLRRSLHSALQQEEKLRTQRRLSEIQNPQWNTSGITGGGPT